MNRNGNIHKKAFLRRLGHETSNERRGELIYTELKLQGHRYTTVAKVLGCTPNGVKNAVMDYDKSERIQTHVAGLLGVDRAELWPRRYRQAA